MSTYQTPPILDFHLLSLSNFQIGGKQRSAFKDENGLYIDLLFQLYLNQEQQEDAV